MGRVLDNGGYGGWGSREWGGCRRRRRRGFGLVDFFKKVWIEAHGACWLNGK